MATATIEGSAHIRLKALRRIAQGTGLDTEVELSDEEKTSFGLSQDDYGSFLMFNIGVLMTHLELNDETKAAYAALGLLSEFYAPTIEERRLDLLEARYGRHWDVEDKALVERQELHGFIAIAYAYPLSVRLFEMVQNRQ